MDKHHRSPPQPDRRNFIAKVAAVVVGGVLAVFPFLAGMFVFLDPLRRKSGSQAPVRVGSLESLPENGDPRQVSVIATQVDIWNRTPNVAIGQVFLQRTGPDTVRALNVICPHAGCPVKYRPGEKPGENHYHCPCHNSSFAIDGRILDPKSPSPRGLDELDVEIREGGEIWIKFQNFRKGVPGKIPA